MMNSSEIKARIEEYYRTRADQNESALLEAAFYLEDNFKITLTDEEICAENLSSARGMEKLVLSRLG